MAYILHDSSGGVLTPWLLTADGLVELSGGAPATPTTPAPVSHFDFHEGSGSTAASSVGGFALTTAKPDTAWAAGGGIQEMFTGLVGPDQLLTEWSVALRFTMSGEPDGDGQTLAWSETGSGVRFGIIGTSSFPSRRIGTFTPVIEMSDDRLDTGTEYRIVFVCTAASTLVYANGVLFATLAGGYTVNFGDPSNEHVLFTDGDNAFNPMREAAYYDVALSADQVTAISV